MLNALSFSFKGHQTLPAASSGNISYPQILPTLPTRVVRTDYIGNLSPKATRRYWELLTDLKMTDLKQKGTALLKFLI